MAQQVSVLLVDDLDGSTAAESVRFGLDGRTYEIDLSAPNAASLRDIFAPFVAGARRAGAAGGTASPVRRSAVAAGSGRADTTAVRDWARRNGIEVSERGRISASVREAYAASQENARPEPVAVLDTPVEKAGLPKVADPFQPAATPN